MRHNQIPTKMDVEFRLLEWPNHVFIGRCNGVPSADALKPLAESHADFYDLSSGNSMEFMVDKLKFQYTVSGSGSGRTVEYQES
jgi:hypothetical protein